MITNRSNASVKSQITTKAIIDDSPLKENEAKIVRLPTTLDGKTMIPIKEHSECESKSFYTESSISV